MSILLARAGLIAMAVCAAAELATAQQSPAASSKKKVQTSTPARPQGLTPDSIVSLVHAGLSEDLIVARIRKEHRAFDLSPQDMIKLKNAGLSDAVLKVMLDPTAEINPPSQQPIAPAQPAEQPAQQPATAIVLPTPLVSGLPISSRPSGATPAAGTSSASDPNDPMTPHDSGIWLHTRDRDGNPKMIVLERAAYQGSKAGGVYHLQPDFGPEKNENEGHHSGSSSEHSHRRTNTYFLLLLR